MTPAARDVAVGLVVAWMTIQIAHLAIAAVSWGIVRASGGARV